MVFMEKTVFEKIIDGEIPCTKVYEDDICLAFLDLHPVNFGHTLVIPKVHARNILTTPNETVGHLYVVAKKIANALTQSVQAEGINIHTNIEEAGGQVIFHTHIHVIPRYKADGLKLWHADKVYEDGQQEILAEKIRASL